MVSRSSHMLQVQLLLFILLLQGAVNLNPVLAQPSVSITAPKDGDTLSGIYTIQVMASAPNDNGIAFVEMFWQQGLIQGEIGIVENAPYNFNWNTSKVDNGTYRLYAKAAANDGINGTSQTITITVSNGVATGATTLPPGSLGILVVILAIVAIGSVVIYKSRSRKNLKLPSTSGLNFVRQ